MASDPTRGPAGQPTAPLLPKGARDALLGLIAALVLLAFAAIYVIVFACTLDVGRCAVLPISMTHKYLAPPRD
jgi:hypothetical protein